MFYHSLVSDWNHGNAHFLRGVATELLSRGHTVLIFEPENGWSYQNLVSEQGQQAVRDFQAAYPNLSSIWYDPSAINLDAALEHADAVIVHEWNRRGLIRRIVNHRKHSKYRVYFHDTHHRCASDPGSIGIENLRDFDGVLVFGESLRARYERNGWASRVWVWHEAADTRMFYPRERAARLGDLVWIGNWGDDERKRELSEFLFEPVRCLKLKGHVFGVRYPGEALSDLCTAGMQYGGWVANFRVPDLFSGFEMTVHIPRGPYRDQLPGVPTIRVFEALACGIPLVSAPWIDSENLFYAGKDYLVARTSGEMTEMLHELRENSRLRSELAEHGLRTIRSRHTCTHRVDQLLDILRQ
jgi:spore maturation protein CgeB